jgi:hypothetical protein
MSELRKLQRNGKSSLVLNLPLEWIRSQGLTGGSYVSCTPTRGKGQALVIKAVREAQEETIGEIN